MTAQNGAIFFQLIKVKKPMNKGSLNDGNVKEYLKDSIAWIQAKMDSGSEAPLLLPLLGVLVHLRDEVPTNKPKVNKTHLSKRPRMAAHVE